jgi:glycosyltransferase involved in cell wall biosynthesis
VLNGLIFALWGVRDVALGLGDPGARDVYEGGVEALAASLSYYDTGWWTRYSLDRDGWDLAAPGSHRLHVTQMEVMARLTRRGEFVRAARRWRRYDAAWNRARRRVAMIRTALEGSPRPAWTGPPRVRAVVHHAYPSDPRVRRESLTLRDAGLDVEVVCQRDPGQRRRELVEGLPVTRLDVEHVDRSALRGVLREYFGFTAAAAVALASGAPEARPELIHVHAPPDFLLAAALVPRLRGARLLLDIHDLSRDMFTSRFGDGIAGRAGAAVLAAVERLACASADEVVTVHQPYADELARRGVRPQKISVVMNAIDERSLEPARRRRKRGDEHEGFTVAYHGTVTQWYGLDLVIEALALARADIPGIRAIVIGVGDAMEPTRRLAAELGLGDRVEFLDAMPQEATLERIATADCGVIPNKPTTLNRFALSSKLFEYVALGIPVAVARLETLARHFDDDEVAFFAPGDFGALASALVSIAKDPRAATARAERARARAQADYSWTSNRDDLLTRVFELVPEPPTALWRPSWWRAAPTATAGS